jgi:hypothetical protein
MRDKSQEASSLPQPLGCEEGIAVGAIICPSKYASAVYKALGPSRPWIKRGELSRSSVITLPPSHPHAAGRSDLLGMALSPAGAAALAAAFAGPAPLRDAVGEELAAVLHPQVSHRRRRCCCRRRRVHSGSADRCAAAEPAAPTACYLPRP